MQLAYNTKFNSGCLSRQVGAVVTREDYSIQSIGWNDVPQRQVSRSLRDSMSYCKNKDSETYSKFEIENIEFSDSIKKINCHAKDKLYGRCMPLCFKDVYNNIPGEKNRYIPELFMQKKSYMP